MSTFEERALRRIPPHLVERARELVQESFTWPRSGEQNLGRKVQCPECGASGYPGGGWVIKHVDHVEALCGKRVTRIGRPTHGRHCRECQGG